MYSFHEAPLHSIDVSVPTAVAAAAATGASNQSILTPNGSVFAALTWVDVFFVLDANWLIFFPERGADDGSIDLLSFLAVEEGVFYRNFQVEIENF